LLSAGNRLVQQLPTSGPSHLIHIDGYRVYQALRPKSGDVIKFQLVRLLANRFDEPPRYCKSASAKAGEVEGHDDVLSVGRVDFHGCVRRIRIGRVVFLPNNETRWT